MIVLFTDFGLSGPYVGQMKAILAQAVPNEPVIDLFADAPAYFPIAAAHLLATYQKGFPADSVFLCVVDPGVGSTERDPMIVRADGHWYVGPGNGLFEVIAARSARVEAWRITWRPSNISASFHGRDLFAPVAAMLVQGAFPQAERIELKLNVDSGRDFASVIYIDHFGNLISGLRASEYPTDVRLGFKGTNIQRVRTFSDVPEGQPLCYENSSGLLEIAVNRGRADILFDALVGDPLELISPRASV